MLQLKILPKTLISIGEDAFYFTEWQNSLGLSNDNLIYSDEILLDTRINSAGSSNSSIEIKTKLEIREGTKLIADGALENCYFFNRIELPDSIEKIGSRAFSNCYSLKEITIPYNTKVMGNHIFRLNAFVTQYTRHLNENKKEVE